MAICVLLAAGGALLVIGPPSRQAPPWLGLDYNSAPGSGRLREFAQSGIVYDREGDLEPVAGDTADSGSELGRGLQRSIAGGMIPDVEVDPAGIGICRANPLPTHVCLPTRPAAIAGYAAGFVRTAQSALRRFPGRRILFEPTNEPWSWASPAGTPSGAPAAAQYARLLVALLARIRSARHPAIALSDVYVPATGELDDGSRWVSDLYAADRCLRPGPGTCGPIEAWNVHPYGLPDMPGKGIESLPQIRHDMLSGADNVIASELGFCARDVLHGRLCGENLTELTGSSAQTSGWLRRTLDIAAEMHRQGWLRAVLVWARSSGGWSMQLPSGRLTAQGRELMSFSAGR